MTRGEAIKHLEEWKKCISSAYRRQVIDMAIEALKDVQNCVHCEHYTEVETDTGIKGECKMDTAHMGDLISRQAAIECCSCLHPEDCWAEIKALPSAEPKTGKWIPVTKVYKPKDDKFPNMHIEWEDATEPDEIDAVKCSECGEVFDFADARNWCTQCGARMRGEEE